MRTLENYLESVQKSHFLLISEAGEDPRVIHRLDPESGCLLVSRLLSAPPPRPLLYGSIPFTRCGECCCAVCGSAPAAPFGARPWRRSGCPAEAERPMWPPT